MLPKTILPSMTGCWREWVSAEIEFVDFMFGFGLVFWR